MLRIPLVFAAACLIGAVGCQPAPASFDPNDPVITATIDSLVQVLIEGAATVDADKVLAGAEGKGELTFLTGDVLLSGLEPIRQQFRRTYSGLLRQDQTIAEKRVRILSRDVVLVLATAEGTYTDQAGWTSPPVGIGSTIVFVREDGQWRVRHAHQSIAP
jgi:uncharacterized protein (TIGR02246 family)